MFATKSFPRLTLKAGKLATVIAFPVSVIGFNPVTVAFEMSPTILNVNSLLPLKLPIPVIVAFFSSFFLL